MTARAYHSAEIRKRSRKPGISLGRSFTSASAMASYCNVLPSFPARTRRPAGPPTRKPLKSRRPEGSREAVKSLGEIMYILEN